MGRFVPIDFACNDPDNGNFQGKVWMASIDGNEIERSDGEVAFTELDGAFRIHRAKFAVAEAKEWVGNWCWNRYWMTVKESNRLASHLRANGWRCTCGDDRFFDWMNEGVTP